MILLVLESKKEYKQMQIAKQKHTHRYGKLVGYQRREGKGQGHVRVMGLKDTSYYVQNISNKDTLYSTGKQSHNIIITLYGDRWLQIYDRDHLIMYIKIESLCYTPEINTILYINYIKLK